MGGQEPKKAKKHICAGLLAHVDAGKTTLSEAMLYISGSIRELGRVDHGNTFFDTGQMERARGITIFSKEALLSFGGVQITLLDTPGHVDFSAEMERTLKVLDCAILVVSGADGVQGHTLTLWKLLARYSIPVFLFINKMDQEGTDRDRLMEELKARLDERCVDFSLWDGREVNGLKEERQAFFEELAMCDEELLERYLERGEIAAGEIRKLLASRGAFACYFGSALKNYGVEELLKGVAFGIEDKAYPESFGAKVFKITRDSQGNRLTHLKITGGSLKVKDILADGEKVNQIRIYSGTKFETVGEAFAGSICAVTGLSRTFAGQGLGAEKDSDTPVLEPVLLFQLLLPEGCDIHKTLKNLQQLEEEDPLLHILWDEQLGEVYIQLMGEVQEEVLKALIKERFGLEVSFGPGHIVYKETIGNKVEGAGHFEPLRHYAEVHLLLEPGEPGSGLQFASACSEDVLDRNWQRLVLTHLEEREHKGVLTGAPITDMRITLISGRAHQKHTEGGDFRQATYRAVRQGLMKAKSILLEPYYDFCLELPAECVGRAMADIQNMSGGFKPPEIEGDRAVLTGCAPAAKMRGYQAQVMAYSKGLGRLTCVMKGYEPCHNAGEVIAQAAYDPELDVEHTPDSVFCSHGAGFIVPWDQVEGYMHVEGWQETDEGQGAGLGGAGALTKGLPERGALAGSLPRAGLGDEGTSGGGGYGGYSGSLESDKELEEIFLRTYKKSGKKSFLPETRLPGGALSGRQELTKREWERREPKEEYLLVDGYNIIFSWEELKELAKSNLDGARHRLMDILCNYQGFSQCRLILVFDAYRVEGHRCEVVKYHNIHVVYTKEAETADQYIEKTVHELGKQHRVRVATSDGLEQVIILGQGGLRMSAADLKEEIEQAGRQLREEYLDKPHRKQNFLFEQADAETAAFLDQVRAVPERGKGAGKGGGGHTAAKKK